jgi:DNA-binding MurR/RpiR family transcriptional regulator
VPDSVLARVRTRLPEFTGALQRVAELVLADPAAARTPRTTSTWSS